VQSTAAKELMRSIKGFPQNSLFEKNDKILHAKNRENTRERERGERENKIKKYDYSLDSTNNLLFCFAFFLIPSPLSLSILPSLSSPLTVPPCFSFASSWSSWR
jgi:hypothetical protein